MAKPMNIYLIILSILVVAGVVYLVYNFKKPNQVVKGEYNSKIQFSLGKIIQFPDFDLKYLGKTKQKAPLGAAYNMGPVYNFQLSKGDEQQDVDWSSGTGVIGPTQFTFNGKEFNIELSHSDKLGRLADNEFVVNQLD